MGKPSRMAPASSTLAFDEDEVSEVPITSRWSGVYIALAGGAGIAIGIVLFIAFGMSSASDRNFALTILGGGVTSDLVFRHWLRRRVMLLSRPAIAAAWVWPVLAMCVALFRPFEPRPDGVDAPQAATQLARAGKTGSGAQESLGDVLYTAYYESVIRPEHFNAWVRKHGLTIGPDLVRHTERVLRRLKPLADAEERQCTELTGEDYAACLQGTSARQFLRWLPDMLRVFRDHSAWIQTASGRYAVQAKRQLEEFCRSSGCTYEGIMMEAEEKTRTVVRPLLR